MFPISPKANSIKITSISPTLTSLTHSLKRQVRRRGGQRWLLDVGFALMTREQFAPIWSFSVAQQGQFKTFQYVPYPYNSTSGDATGYLVTTSALGAGSSTIPINGFSGSLKKGDFIKFAGHTKVYMVIDTVTSFNYWTEGTCSDLQYVDQTPCENGVNEWTNGTCSNPTYTDQLTCEAAVNTWDPTAIATAGICQVESANPSNPLTQEVCNSDPSNNFKWIDGKCAFLPYTNNQEGCNSLDPINYTYIEGVPIATGSCSDPQYTDQASCENGVSEWIDGTCSDPQYTDEGTCLAGLNTWTTIQQCSNPTYTDKASCLENTLLTGVTIEPALHESVKVGEDIIYRDVPFNVAFTKDTNNMNVRVEGLVSYDISLAEIV